VSISAFLLIFASESCKIRPIWAVLNLPVGLASAVANLGFGSYCFVPVLCGNGVPLLDECGQLPGSMWWTITLPRGGNRWIPTPDRRDCVKRYSFEGDCWLNA